LRCDHDGGRPLSIGKADGASLDMKPRPLAVDPKSFERSGVIPPRMVLALASGTTAEEKPLPSVAEGPGPVNLFTPNGGYLAFP
jgi:hypothetical protein